MYNIIIYETLRETPNLRFFEEIEIEIGFPFSTVKFKKEKYELAFEIISSLFLGGFNDSGDDDRIIFFNDEKIKNKDLFI
jgi:hypothetical protein